MARANRRSLNVEGAYRHILTDLYGFAGTLIAGIVIVLWGFDRADAIASLVVVLLDAEGRGGAAAPRLAHPAGGDARRHRRRGGAAPPDGAARGAVGPRPARLDPDVVAARSSLRTSWSPTSASRLARLAACSIICRTACPATSTWRTRRCSSSRPASWSTSSAGTPEASRWVPSCGVASTRSSGGRLQRRHQLHVFGHGEDVEGAQPRQIATRRRAATRRSRPNEDGLARDVDHACAGSARGASSARMTPVPAPSRAGSSTTMSGRPSADSTQRRRDLTLEDAQVGEGRRRCAGRRRRRARSRSTARTEPEGPTASASGTEKRPAPA